MSKMWLVARREYLYNLRRPSFLFAAFGTPSLIVVIWIAAFAVFGGKDNLKDFNQIGYVDHAAVLNPDINGEESAFTFVPYESEDAARADLEAGTLDAYYVIPEDYMSTGNVLRYASKKVPDTLDTTFRRLLLSNLSLQVNVGFPAARLLDPIGEMTVVLQDSGRELEVEAVPVLILMPMFFAILFSLAMQTTSSFMMNGLVKETSNRVLEILVTTITPMQLLMGKIIGLGLLGLTQVSVWLLVAFPALALGPKIEALSFLKSIQLPFDLAAAGIVYFILGYFLTSTILATIGVLAGSEQQSNQYAAIVNLTGYLIPLLLVSSFFEDSNGTVPTLLSIVPLTSTVAMMLRIGMGAVPLWQIALSIILMLISIVFVAWGSAKLFRWGLLMYGKRFNVRDLMTVVFGQREMGVTSQQEAEVIQEGTA